MNSPILWLSDLHLDFYEDKNIPPFLEKVAARNPSRVLISGDISNSRNLERHLRLISRHLPCEVDFILGNHDFYGSSFAAVNELVKKIIAECPNLRRLGSGETLALSPKIGLIGCDGWADGRAGSGSKSKVVINDFNYIFDLRDLYRDQLYLALAKRGDVFADYLRNLLPQALNRFDEVWILTHVPPFPDASMYNGKMCEPDFLPHFSTVGIGHVLNQFAQRNPGKKLRVLCGHTHHKASIRPRPNLMVDVNGSDYHKPDVQELRV